MSSNADIFVFLETELLVERFAPRPKPFLITKLLAAGGLGKLTELAKKFKVGLFTSCNGTVDECAEENVGFAMARVSSCKEKGNTTACVKLS